MLRGNRPATVDGKGRLKIPAEFKTYLDENFGPDYYVTSLTGQYARLYPFAVWKEIEDRLSKLPTMNKSKRKFLDRTNYYGQMARIDSQGRILIPATLRESAAMQGVVAVMGYLNYLDVWNNERYREYLDREPLSDEDEATLSNLGI